MAYASYSPTISSGIQPLVPALKSNWLIAHVLTCFSVTPPSALPSVESHVPPEERGKTSGSNMFIRIIPESSILDDLNYQMVVIGFLLLTLGIITGSVWAHSAWGVTGVGIPRKPGLSSPGSCTRPCCTPAWSEVGEARSWLSFPSSGSPVSSLPTSGSTTSRVCTVTRSREGRLAPHVPVPA